MVLLLFRAFSTRLLTTLDDATAERECLRAALTALQEKEQEFRSLAYHDDLTGLPNRSLFYDRLNLAIRHSSREGGRLAVLFLDLDGFKAVNDSFGHEGGDRVLVELATRISAGVSVFPDDSASPESLVRDADAAMYRAKRGRDVRRTPACSTVSRERRPVAETARAKPGASRPLCPDAAVPAPSQPRPARRPVVSRP